MTRTMTILCVAASATVSALALYAATAGAAPLSAPLAATSADIQSTEAVQYNRRHHSRWGGRAYHGFGYNSYARAPGYGGPRYFGRRPHSCSREQAEDEGYPSWWCSRIRTYQ